jgi:hypothetical protein
LISLIFDLKEVTTDFTDCTDERATGRIRPII